MFNSGINQVWVDLKCLCSWHSLMFRHYFNVYKGYYGSGGHWKTWEASYFILVQTSLPGCWLGSHQLWSTSASQASCHIKKIRRIWQLADESARAGLWTQDSFLYTLTFQLLCSSVHSSMCWTERGAIYELICDHWMQEATFKRGTRHWS